MIHCQKSIKSPFFYKIFVALLFFLYFCIGKRHKNVHLGKVPSCNRGIPFPGFLFLTFFAASNKKEYDYDEF